MARWTIHQASSDYNVLVIFDEPLRTVQGQKGMVNENVPRPMLLILQGAFLVWETVTFIIEFLDVSIR